MLQIVTNKPIHYGVSIICLLCLLFQNCKTSSKMREFEGYLKTISPGNISVEYTPLEDSVYTRGINVNIIHSSRKDEYTMKFSVSLNDAVRGALSPQRRQALANNEEILFLNLFVNAEGVVSELRFSVLVSKSENSILNVDDLNAVKRVLKGIRISIPPAFEGSEGYRFDHVFMFSKL